MVNDALCVTRNRITRPLLTSCLWGNMHNELINVGMGVLIWKWSFSALSLFLSNFKGSTCSVDIPRSNNPKEYLYILFVFVESRYFFSHV